MTAYDKNPFLGEHYADTLEGAIEFSRATRQTLQWYDSNDTFILVTYPDGDYKWIA